MNGLRIDPPPPARFTVGVMGSSADEHDDLAKPLGELQARLGVNLLTGGGRGVMTAVSRAFVRSPRVTGICIGVIPCLDAQHRTECRPGYPNPFVELPIFTHLHETGARGKENLSRNHINILSSNVIVASPGGPGTASEAALALEYERPAITYCGEHKQAANFPESIPCANSLAEVEMFIERHRNGDQSPATSPTGERLTS